MDGIEFKEQNQRLGAPAGHDPNEYECYALPVYIGEGQVISKWKMTWRERLHCLVRGYVWVFVKTHARTQPPITVQGYKSAFE